MIPTPSEVLPVLAPATGSLRDALRKGVAFADELQPSRDDRDPWFWSHSARHMTLKQLLLANPQPSIEGFEVRSGIPNSGIHLRFQDLHIARVVRSLGGTTPAPGRNLARRRDWTNPPVQGQLPLADGVALVPLSLIIDWQEMDGEPLIHVALPRNEWGYRKKEALYWRVPMPDEGVDLSTLAFDTPEDGFDGTSILDIDEAELSADGR